MSPVRASIEIDAPPSVVWPYLAEFRFWPEWGPTVRGVESEARGVAAGVRGRVQTVIGLWLPFEIGRCETERFWDWSVAGVKATGHRLRPIGADRTEVEFSVARIFFPYVWVLERGLRRLKTLAEDRSE